MKNLFEKPYIDVIKLSTSDVLTISLEDGVKDESGVEDDNELA